MPPSTIDINNINIYTSYCKVVTKSIVLNMPKIKEKIINCPVEKTLNIIGKKWAVLIIRNLLSGKKKIWPAAGFPGWHKPAHSFRALA